MRIHQIPAPSGFIIWMHGNARIPVIFQIWHNRCRSITDILLINNGSHRKKCHGISGHKFPLRIRSLRAKYRRKCISLRCILFQRIDKRCERHVGLQIPQHTQIGKRFIHNGNDRRIFCFFICCAVILFIGLIGFLQFFDLIFGISFRSRNKTVTNPQYVIQQISIAISSLLFPRLCVYIISICCNDHTT